MIVFLESQETSIWWPEEQEGADYSEQYVHR